MNLLVKKLKASIIVLLVPLFFVSCEDPGKIGLNVNPKSGAIVTKYKEFILPSSQVQFDPRSTVNSSSLQAGSYSDLDFGIISSKSYTWLGVQSAVPVLSETALYVNTTFSIQFSTIYGSEAEDDEIESFEIYQLADGIESSVDYKRVDELALGTQVGNLNLYLQDNDTLQTDSLFTVDIDEAFGKAMFDKLVANDGTYNDDTTFNEYFKGIGIIPSTGNNKIIQFNASTFSLDINYTEVNSAGETVDRVYSFNLGNRRFYNLESDLSGTPLANMQPDNIDRLPNDDFRYLQSGIMIALKLDYDALFMFMDTIENIVIQKAFLTAGDIPVNQPGSDHPFSLIGYFTDDNNLWPAKTESSNDSTTIYTTLQNEFTAQSGPSFPGYYFNPQEIITGAIDTLTYEASMSNLIQNLHAGGYDDPTLTPLEPGGKLILFPATSATDAQSSPSHALTHYFKVHKDSIKLKIHYSVPNQ